MNEGKIHKLKIFAFFKITVCKITNLESFHNLRVSWFWGSVTCENCKRMR